MLAGFHQHSLAAVPGLEIRENQPGAGLWMRPTSRGLPLDILPAVWQYPDRMSASKHRYLLVRATLLGVKMEWRTQ